MLLHINNEGMAGIQAFMEEALFYFENKIGTSNSYSTNILESD